MQADEDVGKIALAVPVLVSRALELFLQDLIDRTYEITLQSGAKTLNSFHLKQCVKRYSSFDFLTEVVNKVPDLGGADSCGDERGLPRRRKSNGSDPENDESRSSKMVIRSSLSPRGCGRGRGRGRGRPPTKRKEVGYVQFEDESSMYAEQGEPLPGEDTIPETNHGNESIPQSAHPPVETAPAAPAPATSSKVEEANTDHQADWPMPDAIGNIGAGPSGFGHLTVQVDEDEDYDNED
ncbi:hypothetical protein PR202_ga22242 [Eleusine coracana subsp. coracana]|uniref:Transcription factor CBF/NF-Y/archaeal histone domain-containing protein n=1 Tax=Eleusine coracana subsp. coracana TaxID=191504 RepID=A0AAV5D318_ELECO|nr:hypothetical protein PR202_ga22242 [Eleusine coracana subsp. coracana]